MAETTSCGRLDGILFVSEIFVATIEQKNKEVDEYDRHRM